MSGFIMIIFLVFLFLVVRSFFRIRREQKLRDNYPSKRVIEVSLPSGEQESRIKMAKFWRKVYSNTTRDNSSRKQGVGQVDFVYLTTVAAPGSMPQTSFLIYSDPEKMDYVKRAIKGQFRDCDVIEHEEDPLVHIAEAVKPKKKESAPEMGIHPESNGPDLNQEGSHEQIYSGDLYAEDDSPQEQLNDSSKDGRGSIFDNPISRKVKKKIKEMEREDA